MMTDYLALYEKVYASTNMRKAYFEGNGDEPSTMPK